MRKYCSIDVETTGLDPENCDLIEVGAVVDDLDNMLGMDALPRFHCYVAKKSYRGEPYALSMHGTIFRRIADRTPGYLYLPEADVVSHLHSFLWKHLQSIDKIVVAGKNFLGLDRPFLSKLPGFQRLNFHHRPLDPGMLYWNPKSDKEVPGTKECLIRAGLPNEVAHTAVEDALAVVSLLRMYSTKFFIW